MVSQVSGIPVMGGVTGVKKTIVEKDVEKKSVGRAAGNPTMFTGGRALREAPRVHVEKNVGRASGNPTRFTGGELFEKRPVFLREICSLRVELFEKRLMFITGPTLKL